MFIGPNDDKWKDLHSLGQALYAIDPKGSPKIQVENVVRHYAELISGRDVDQELEEVEGDLKILREIASRYKSINRMLQDLTLDPPEKGVKKDREDRLTLSTIHSGKGLEWKHVFLIQANDIPYLRFGSKNVDFDEERRILYVALTRAKDNLVITWIQGEKCHLSQFLAALPPKLLTWDKTHSRNPWSRGW
jgi:DNA helicase-2/ATP-dependent DNA helicase PcrA